MAAPVVTGLVRFSYCHVFEPSSMVEGGTEKYSVSILIDKSDKKTLSKIRASIQEAKQIGKVSKWGGKIPKMLKEPLRDGDIDREDDEVYEDTFFLNANSTKRPGIVDENLQAIISKEDFYSGCYGRASLSFYPFDANGNKGIACGLCNLQKLKDGDSLDGGSSSPEDDFGSNDDLL